MLLPAGGRVAIIGAGPGGLAAAKYAIEAGFDTTVFESGSDLGGQWNATCETSGVWPGMHTNTSRAMTAFSDFPMVADVPLYPSAEQVHAYLHAYARRFGVLDRIRPKTPVKELSRGWKVNGERFDGVIIASGRFHRPSVPVHLTAFSGTLIHAYDYPGADPFRNQRTLVYGNGISGLEIASDLAAHTLVVSACRKSRYVIQKVANGIPSDWQWYTMFGALERRYLGSSEWADRHRARILAVAGHPAEFGAPEPDRDLRVAGVSLCQNYLRQVRDQSIRCRPAITAVASDAVTFSDGATERFDSIICATGYEPHLPYLDDELRGILAAGAHLYKRTLHPDLPGFGAIGQFLAQGPYFPLLELQARWIVAGWTGQVPLADPARMRAAIARGQPPIDAHNVLALTLAEELGVAPAIEAWPDLADALNFGPLLPARWRLTGPESFPAAVDLFTKQLATSPRTPVSPNDRAAMRTLGTQASTPNHDTS